MQSWPVLWSTQSRIRTPLKKLHPFHPTLSVSRQENSHVDNDLALCSLLSYPAIGKKKKSLVPTMLWDDGLMREELIWNRKHPRGMYWSETCFIGGVREIIPGYVLTFFENTLIK